MDYSIATTAAPTALVVTPADIEAYARLVDVSAEMEHVKALIDAATKQAERYTNRAFCTQTFRMSLDCFPSCNTIRLPRPPLQSVTHVKYYDTAGTLQTFSSAYYHVDIDAQPGRIALVEGQAWPATLGRPQAVQVTYVAGYGAGTAVPENIRLAVKMLVKTWYDSPDMYNVGNIVNELPMAVKDLLGMEEMVTFA